MSDEQTKRPTTDDRDAWRAYWAAQGMPWRTEPEIDEERQQYLAERRAVAPDIEKGMYPFKAIKLDRADVEWLLATHADGRWLIDAKGTTQGVGGNLHIRQGLDLRGAILTGQNLRRLPLAQLRCGLEQDDWFAGTVEQREHAAIHLEGADLRNTDLELAALRSAHLEGADLRNANLTEATLRDAHLEGTCIVSELSDTRTVSKLTHLALRPADLRRSYFSIGSTLDGVHLGDMTAGFVRLADVRWGGANIGTVNWASMLWTGDEQEAKRRRGPNGYKKDGRTRLNEFEEATRAYVQISTLLRKEGLVREADRFAYRAQLCQRVVLRRQVFLRVNDQPHGLIWRARKLTAYLGSDLLDLVSGYGYRPFRSVVAYILIIGIFAGLYLLNGQFAAPHLRWDEALVLSISSFHGRGFFSSGISLGDTLARLAAGEAIIGLLIEITFIATFTQRFFAR
jgi:uncharacterized protein YjbI with pentapeptide repeats